MSAALQASALIDDLPPGAARWHASRPDILVRALTLTNNGPLRLMALGRAVVPLMPKRPLASQDLRSTSLHSGTGLLPLDSAIDCPWVSLDGQQHRNVLAIDIDHPDAMGRWLALPAAIRPILVLDPWTGRAHAIAPLVSPVCIAPNARAQPKRLASFAGRLMAAALGGTLLPFHPCVKWPWGRRETVVGELVRPGSAPVHPHLYNDTLREGLCWHTEAGAGPLELRAIVEALDGEWRATAGPPRERYGRIRGKPDERGRNCALFDLVRWWAYEHFECDRARILDQAVAVNGRFPVPLPAKEVAAVAKSISKFMATKFRRRGTGASRALRGRDRNLTADLSIL